MLQFATGLRMVTACQLKQSWNLQREVVTAQMVTHFQVLMTLALWLGMMAIQANHITPLAQKLLMNLVFTICQVMLTNVIGIGMESILHHLKPTRMSLPLDITVFIVEEIALLYTLCVRLDGAVKQHRFTHPHAQASVWLGLVINKRKKDKEITFPL